MISNEKDKEKTKKDNDKKELRRTNILTKPILPLMIKMSIPTIIGMLVTIIYSLTDTFFIGLLENRSMTASIGLVFSFISFIQAIAFWFGYGSGNMMSKKLGEKDYKEVEIYSSTGIVFALLSGFFITILSFVFVKPLVGFLGGNASENLFLFTTQYLKVLILGIPFILYSIVIYNQLRLCGNTKDAMLGLLSGMLSNMILDPIFIFGFKMGFIGAGYATLTGQIIGAICLTFIAEKNGNIPIRLNKAQFNREKAYHILAGGAPNFSRQAITSLALILLNIVASRYSESLIAALTVSSRMLALFYMIVIGWGQGFQPICAMNYGAKQYDRVKKAFNLSVGIGTVYLIVSAIIVFVFAKNLIQSMSRDEQVVEIGTQILRIQCFTLPLFGYFTISSMLMQNVGKYLLALIISISRQGLLYIPLLFILPSMFNQLGVYLVQPVADVFAFIFSFVVCLKYFQGDEFNQIRN